MTISSRGIAILAAAFGPIILVSCVHAWGPETHDAVTRAAIAALPNDVHGFYGRNERLITGLDNLPDMWRDTHRKQEGFHHFIDLDLLDNPPFDNIPRGYSAAEHKYGRAKLMKAGVLPWAIQGRYFKLVLAMRRRNLGDIAVQSALLSHYVADGHNPLHTTSKYDGRTPEQKGIHQRLEMDVADKLVTGWRLETRPARMISNVPDEVLQRLAITFAQVDAIYEAEETAAKADPTRGDQYKRVFVERIEPIAVSRLQSAASHLADLYYTAWLTAGKPRLPAKAAPLFWGR